MEATEAILKTAGRGIRRFFRPSCPNSGRVCHAELTTTNIYAHTVTDARAVIGRLDSANPRKQKGGVEGEVQEI